MLKCRNASLPINYISTYACVNTKTQFCRRINLAFTLVTEKMTTDYRKL